ncbi:MAG: 3-deoxy-D-manno-octulosonic acid transferase [bacterium]
MLRYLYTLLLFLSYPIYANYLRRKYKTHTSCNQRFSERIGFYTQKMPKKPCIWIHTASFGEAKGMTTLIDWLITTYPNKHILITTTTPSGADFITTTYTKKITHSYFPFDLPPVIHRFIHHFKPTLLLVMEKELWPNLYHILANKKIPIILANARIDKKSVQHYQRIKGLARKTLNHCHYILSQSETDKGHFLSLGVNKEKLKTCGNLKFELSINEDAIKKGQDFKQTRCPQRFIYSCVSTRDGEETLLLTTLKSLKKTQENLLLVLIPRHPERKNDILNFCKKNKLSVECHSANNKTPLSTDIYLVDTLGEAIPFCACADLIFVGGSLVPIGGHNILEPAALEKCILVGPYMDHYKSICNTFKINKAIHQLTHTNDLESISLQLIQNNRIRQETATKAKKLLQASKGSLEKHCEIIQTVLN